MALICPSCGQHSPVSGSSFVCTCGDLLEVERAPLANRPDFRARKLNEASGVWRFRELVDGELTSDQRISLGEGDTPLLDSAAVARFAGVDELYLKHEGHNPTGSFKDRGMTVALSRARAAGARRVACASTGNTAASMAAYAARAELDAVVLLPAGATATGKLSQALAHGARVLRIDGDFDAAMGLVRVLADEGRVSLLNSLNPFRLEGQKTILLEVLEALEDRPPDWFVFPAGNLGNCAAFGKILRELRGLGWIDSVPRLAAIQAAGAAPFAAAFSRGFDRLEAVRAETRATAIRIGAPVSYKRAVRALEETRGVAVAVDDDAIFRAKRVVDGAGIGAEPASCASVAGLAQLVGDGLIRSTDRVVCLLTGHLLKDPEANFGSYGEERGANQEDVLPATLQSLRAAIDG